MCHRRSLSAQFPRSFPTSLSTSIAAMSVAIWRITPAAAPPGSLGTPTRYLRRSVSLRLAHITQATPSNPRRSLRFTSFLPAFGAACGCVTTACMERDAVLNVRVPHQVKRAVIKAAEDDHGRSLSAMVVRILSEWCAVHGYMSESSKRGTKRKRS